MSQEIIIRCDECGEKVLKGLINNNNGPEIGLACGCRWRQYYGGVEKQDGFGELLPDEWYTENE